MRPEIFDEWVRGRTCEACAIFRRDVLCFVLGWSRAEDSEQSDVSNFYLVHHLSDSDAEGKSRDFGVKFTGDTRRRLAVNHAAPELIMVAEGGNVLRHNNQGGKSEKMLSEDDIVGARAVRFIGDHFYVAGGVRSVLRREGQERWTRLTAAIQDRSLSPKETLWQGFDDIDGFSESDVYAVGGHGDVWHFNGRRWSCVDLPTNAELASVCCATDGQVYIGGLGHLILRGRGEEWKIVSQAETNRIYRQIVEFNGRVFAVDEWGSALFEIKPDGVAEVDTGDFALPPTSCLCMAVGHGMLLTAGLESASLFDGKSWRSVFRSEEADDVMLTKMMLDETDAAVGKLLKDLDDLDEP